MWSVRHRFLHARVSRAKNDFVIRLNIFYCFRYSGIASLDSVSTSVDFTQPGPSPFVAQAVNSTCDEVLVFAFGVSFSTLVANAPLVTRDSTVGNFVADTVIGVGSFSVTGNITAGSRGYIIQAAAFKSVSCPSFITNSITSGQSVTVSGNAAINQPIVVNGTVIVTGNLTISSPIVFGSGGVIRVAGNAVISSTVVVSNGNIIVGGTITFAAGSAVTPIVDDASSTKTVVVTIASYTAIVGVPSFNSAVLTATVPPGQCATLSNPTPNVGDTALTVTIQVNVNPCNNPSAAPVLSTAAIIGIVVGGVVFLALTALIIGLIVQRQQKKRLWGKVNKTLSSFQM